MSDMGWTTYINDIETGNYEACIETRKKLGLSPDPDAVQLDCQDRLCHEFCPFNKNRKEVA